jgi:hypothetical protein
MAVKYQVEISQNGWEYTGYAWIECQGGVVPDENDRCAVFAGNVRIQFDEEIGHIKKIAD